MMPHIPRQVTDRFRSRTRNDVGESRVFIMRRPRRVRYDERNGCCEQFNHGGDDCEHGKQAQRSIDSPLMIDSEITTREILPKDGPATRPKTAPRSGPIAALNEPPSAEALAGDFGERIGTRLRAFSSRRLNHHADQRFGPARPQQHAPRRSELGFGASYIVGH